jgi:hypothetical protein
MRNIVSTVDIEKNLNRRNILEEIIATLEELMPTFKALALIAMAMWVLMDVVSKIIHLLPPYRRTAKKPVFQEITIKTAATEVKAEPVIAPEKKYLDEINNGRIALGLQPLSTLLGAEPPYRPVSEVVKPVSKQPNTPVKDNPPVNKTSSPKPSKKRRKPASKRKTETVKAGAN